MKTRPNALSAFCLLSSCGLAAEAQKIFFHPSLPARTLDHVSPLEANLMLSHYLQLAAFQRAQAQSASDGELFNFYQYLSDVSSLEQPFVGAGLGSAVLLSIDGVEEQDFLPHSTFSNALSVVSQPSSDTGLVSDALVSTYLHQAAHVYPSVSSSHHLASPSPRVLDLFKLSNSKDVAIFLNDLSALVEFVDSVKGSESSPRFGAFEVHGLGDIRSAFGDGSEEYRTALNVLKATLASGVAKSLRIAILASPEISHNFAKRQPPQTPFPSNQTLPPQEPFFSTSTCFTTLDACTNGTDSCSGHGACTNATRTTKSGERTCFVCACQTTVSDKGKKQTWVGTACERKDISGPFTLLAGTAVFLLALLIGSVSLLYSVGNEELPGTLTAGASGPSASKRD